MKSTTQKRRVGRPTRAEASAAALAEIDVQMCDPIRILQAIASDPTAPAAARVAACRALIKTPAVVENEPLDAITRRAIASLSKGKLN